MSIQQIDFSSTQSLTQSLITGIPILAATQLKVVSLTDNEIEISAPLQANINVHNTGFAGSLYVVGVISAWAMINYKMQQRAITQALVAAQAAIEYHRPVKGDFVAQCYFEADIEQQLKDWSGEKNLSLQLTSKLYSQSQNDTPAKHCATLTANYAILADKR